MKMKKIKRQPQLILPPDLPQAEARVLIAVPSGNTWEADFGMSLVALIASAVNPPEGYASLSVAIQNTKGSILPQLRTQLVQKAQEIKATHILFIDSDMQFPNWMLHRLLEHKQPIVACNCVTKSIPTVPTARTNDGTKTGKPVRHFDYTDGSISLLEVWRVGTGIMLIDLEVFEKIGHPYFPIYQVGEEFVGEDWGFCERVQAAGIPIYVDVELSPFIGHIGRLAYTADMQDCAYNKPQVIDKAN